MLYRKMNTSGDDLSILGLGCMRLPQKKGTPGDGPIDEKRAESQIKLAIEKGINYFDTAMPYHMGSCEPFLGKILSDDYRSRIKLATKLPPWSVNKSEDMNLIFKSQLKRLRTDHIGYYLLHALNGESWQKLKAFGVCEFLTSLKKDGMIGNAGFSFHGSRKSFEAIVDDFDWDFC